jgi:hypothetical protein
MLYILPRELHGKIPCERPNHRCKDNIKMGVGEIGYEGTNLVQRWAFVNTVMKLRIPLSREFINQLNNYYILKEDRGVCCRIFYKM